MISTGIDTPSETISRGNAFGFKHNFIFSSSLRNDFEIFKFSCFRVLLEQLQEHYLTYAMIIV